MDSDQNEILDIVNKLLSQKIGQRERLEYIKRVIETNRNLAESERDYLYSFSSITDKDGSVSAPIPKNHCTSCRKRLKFTDKKTPRKNWGITGKLCKRCHADAESGITVFDATCKQGIAGMQTKSKMSLIVKNYSGGQEITLYSKKPKLTMTVPKQKITRYDRILHNDGNLGSVIKARLGQNTDTEHLHLQFVHDTEYNVILDLGDLERAFKEIDYMMLSNRPDAL